MKHFLFMQSHAFSISNIIFCPLWGVSLKFSIVRPYCSPSVKLQIPSWPTSQKVCPPWCNHTQQGDWYTDTCRQWFVFSCFAGFWKNVFGLRLQRKSSVSGFKVTSVSKMGIFREEWHSKVKHLAGFQLEQANLWMLGPMLERIMMTLNKPEIDGLKSIFTAAFKSLLFSRHSKHFKCLQHFSHILSFYIKMFSVSNGSVLQSRYWNLILPHHFWHIPS